jgi:hypothetical protein
MEMRMKNGMELTHEFEKLRIRNGKSNTDRKGLRKLENGFAKQNKRATG